MKTPIKYTASALLSLILCAIMLCGAIIPTSAAKGELPSLDYRNELVETSGTLSAYELYSMLLEQTSSVSGSQKPTEGEKLYLEGSNVQFNYTDFIPDSCIDTHYDGDKATLYITLLPYTYTAVNGAEVTWVPNQLILDGQSYTFVNENNVYTARITDCYQSKDFEMQVDYVWQVELPQEIISFLRNEAYEKGYDAHVLMEEYRQKLAEYQALVDMQNKWDAYQQWEEDYANYVVQKAIYDELKAKYDAYMVEYNARQALIDARNQWDNYFKQNEEYEEKIGPYEAYLAYYTSYTAAVDKLAMFNAIYDTEPRGWCMYNDIMGGSVTEVLKDENQKLLVAGGCNAADIKLANQSTQNLRVLLKGYNDLRVKSWPSEYEKNKALYNYYIENYEALTKNFCNLYKTLKGLYENPAVSGFIGLKGKSEHYRQLVGHLFVISTALDEKTTRDESSWRMDRKKLFDVIDENVHYFPDGDWDPRTTAFPEAEVPYAERVEKPVLPTVENPSYIPPAPAKVENPGEAPAVVENPAGTPRPETLKPIGEKPNAPVFDQVTEQLCQDVENGLLKSFGQTVAAEFVTITKRLERQISIKNLKTITLYKLNGDVYQQLSVDYGSGIQLDPLVFEEVEGYDYEWYGWVQLRSDGTRVPANTTCVTENISLYPHYKATPKEFTITWVIGNNTYEMRCYYDRIPDPTPYIRLPSDDPYYTYTFVGWDREIEPVKGDATYYGNIERTPRKFKVTWVLEDGAKVITEEWEYNQKPAFKGELSYQTDTCKYTFRKWDTPISSVTGDVTYKAKYDATPFASSSNSNTVIYDVTHSDTEITVHATKDSAYIKEAALLADELGKTLTVCWEGKLSISFVGEELKTYIDGGCLPLSLTSNQKGNATFYYFKYVDLLGVVSKFPQATVNFETAYVSGKQFAIDVMTSLNKWERIEEGFVANGDFTIRVQEAYAIIPEANQFCNFSQLSNKAAAGEVVSLDLSCRYGYKIVGAKVTDVNGNEIPLTGLSFQMPQTAVSVVLQVEQIVYTLTFMVDGEVWHTAQYYAGEVISLPENPTKEANGEYVYTFTGWGNVPAVAAGEEENLVFEASWAESTTMNDYDSGHNNNVLFGVVVPCVLAAIVLVIGFFVLRKQAKKMGGWRVLWVKVLATLKKWFNILKSQINKLFKNTNKPTQSKK